MRDNSGYSPTVKGSGIFTSKVIWISRGIVIILTRNAFWKLFDWADLSALLKTCGLFAVLYICKAESWDSGFILGLGCIFWTTSITSLTTLSINSFLLCSSALQLYVLPFRYYKSQMNFGLSCLLETSSSYIRLCWVLLILSVINIILNLAAFSETVSHCK